VLLILQIFEGIKNVKAVKAVHNELWINCVAAPLAALVRVTFPLVKKAVLSHMLHK
jgi:hypothetical protein